MKIADQILTMYPELNDAQKSIISHDNGPLLVIAGPGSGKTFSMVLRVLNLLLNGKANPQEIIVCTFTEKAALELRDRISGAASKVKYTGDLAELRATTINSLCNRLIIEYRHKTRLGNNFETLDELTQLLFIFDCFEEIIGEPINGKYLNRWKTKWSSIEGIRDYFNKITEELVDPASLETSSDLFVQLLGSSYKRYEDLLFQQNKIDFSHQQKILFELLSDDEIRESISSSVKYIIVDEYQDTNYIQEQLILRIGAKTNNISVVGDEDQSIYRFRGATVRNILEFSNHFPNCPQITMTTNYRSHRTIIGAYDRWMTSADWSNPNSSIAFRYNKTIEPIPSENYPEYPAVFSIWGTSESDEANRIADFVTFLKSNNVIQDYNQVAILLHSVRFEHSGKFISALEKKGISSFCPRARAYFDNEEVEFIVACYALILGYYGTGRGNVIGRSLNELSQYVDSCIVKLAKKYGLLIQIVKF